MVVSYKVEHTSTYNLAIPLECILYDSTYVKSKNRQNKFMVTEIRKCCLAGGRKLEEIGGMEYERTVLYLLLGGGFTVVSNCQNSTEYLRFMHFYCLFIIPYAKTKIKQLLTFRLCYGMAHLISLQSFP